MLEQLSKERRNWVLLGLGALALWLAWSLRAVINPLLLGYLMAFIANPMVRSLESRGWQHRNAVAAVFAGSFLVTGLILLGLFLQSRSLIEDLLRTAGESEVTAAAEPGVEPQGSPDGSEAEGDPEEEPAEEAVGMLQSWLDRADGWLDSLPGAELLPDLPSESEVTGGLSQWLLSDSEGGDSVGVQALSVIASNLRRLLDALFGIGELVLLVPLYAFFWMFELDQLHAWIRRHLPWRHRGQLVRFSGKVGDIVSSFFRGRLVVCVLK
ncbi:MAG: AI-2E family transporter, partial [Planctomycetota bacterium]